MLDASIAITWAIADEDHPLADLAFSRLTVDFATVPAIWWYEMRNILVLSERRARIAPEDSAGFLQELAQLSIEIAPLSDSSHIMDLARKHTLSVYDAAYLALSIREGLPLATLDRKLESAAMAEGVPLLT